jgi:hypothetical protein
MSGICEGCEHSVLWKGKEALQSFHIPRANDMHGSRQELDDNEQHIQPRTNKRGENERGMEVFTSTWRVLRALQFFSRQHSYPVAATRIQRARESG